MKKFFVFLAAIALIAGMSFGQQVTRTLNLNVTVAKYVELNMAYPTTLDFGTISPPQLGPTSGEGFEARGATNIAWEWFPEFAYANCPYSLTLTGSNPAGDQVPVFARQEDGQSRYDRLVTALTFHFTSDYAGAMSAIQYNPTFVYPNPASWNITSNRDTPHTGEVFLKPRVGVRFPHQAPDFSHQQNTWDQSPDAGLYQASVTITIAAI